MTDPLLQVQGPGAPARREREPLDLYATRPEVAKAIVARIAAELAPPAIVIEPSAGPGRFVAEARAAWPKAVIVAVDIDGAHRPACVAAGATSFIEADWATAASRPGRMFGPHEGPVLILGNPPFSHAVQHVTAALELLRPGEHLVFLLRQSIRGSVERVGFWARSPLEEAALVIPRPSFVGGNDTGEYEVLRWTKGHGGRATIAPPILWGSAAAEARAAELQLDLLGKG